MASPDRSIRMLLAVIAVLLTANLLVQMNATPRLQAASAPAGGIPDSGAQFQAMVDGIKELNSKVDRVQTFMESGKLSVKVTEMPKAEK